MGFHKIKVTNSTIFSNFVERLHKLSPPTFFFDRSSILWKIDSAFAGPFLLRISQIKSGLFCEIEICELRFRKHSNYISILFCNHLLFSVLFPNVLFPILFYSILFCSILFYSILFYSILFYSILFYSILFYSILFYSVLFYSILFHFFYYRYVLSLLFVIVMDNRY